MPRSYAVFWREGSGGVCVGQLEPLRGGFRLEGAQRSGSRVACEITADEIVSISVGRGPAERIDGRPSLIVERSANGRLLIASAMGVGMLHEIADRIGSLGNGDVRKADTPFRG
jgi:hypothetical protein